MRKKILLGLLIVVLAIQLYRPEKNISTEIPSTDFFVVNKAPENIETMVKNACYDCHSNNTRYPWYNNIAPVSWWLASHIHEGKEHLDFSLWESYALDKKQKKLEHIVKAINKRWMPLESYVPLHSEADLSDDQIKQLTDWFKTLEN